MILPENPPVLCSQDSCNRAFSAAGFPDKGDGAAGRQIQTDPFQDFPVLFISKMDILHGNIKRPLRQQLLIIFLSKKAGNALFCTFPAFFVLIYFHHLPNGFYLCCAGVAALLQPFFQYLSHRCMIQLHHRMIFQFHLELFLFILAAAA